ncbi:23S rRNA pseudouridine(1911/1915/1917) synthase RluD [Echinimonas agarilytica]|uniref:Pseudouridine synthase n=1 Tax=Echinimonas agarilytica TaxID=1215918 RepID=A0AA41W9H4_9GAMM|nr:23S rRNA pseudouridine(1911/1915/1917) synthase RluD [Echinimonas agarilytica]MCM2680616.1 23S rRNA pseudouridine(1911/1915/1917) synthase RluD [Echinimonas agarilytica]
MAQEFSITAELSSHQFGQRLDQALAEVFPDYSRTRVQAWIADGRAEVDGKVVTKGREKVMGTEKIVLNVVLEDEVTHQPEDIDLDIIYEDDDILVINKPAGLVVHPGAGNQQGTLLNALLHYLPAQIEVPRAGIVHRLDKDTTGLMVVAKTVPAQTHLVSMLQDRNITREYEAIAVGVMTAGGMVEEPISRHPNRRTAMAVHPNGKEAVTHYRVAEKFAHHTRLRLRLETGRTHQIRVHMAHLHHALVGDPTYGGRNRLPKGASPEMVEALRGFRRQALHAARLILEHPITGEKMDWQAPIPDDMKQLTEVLREDARRNPSDIG